MGLCPDGVFYDNIHVNGIDLNIIPDPDHPEISIQNPPGTLVPFAVGMSCGGPLTQDHGCSGVGGGSTFRILNSPSGSSIGGFARIINDRGDCAIDVRNSQLTITGRSSSTPRIYSVDGLAFHVQGTSASPAEVTFYSGSIEESVVGLVLHGYASFAGNDVHIQGHTELGVEALYNSSLLLVDSSLEDNGAVAWFCDDAEVVVENVGIVNNSIASSATKEQGIWLEDQSTLDAFNVLAHHNDFSDTDVGFVYLRDDSELSLASSTFADNEAAYEIQWIHDARVDIVDTIFHDSTEGGGGSGDSLYCNTTVPSTADYVNGYGYLHGDGIGPFVGGATVWNTSSSRCALSNNTAVDPSFALGTYNKYYLQQTGSSKLPLIDAGSDDAEDIYDFDLGAWTTDPDLYSPASDYGTPVDLGYHQLPPP